MIKYKHPTDNILYVAIVGTSKDLTDEQEKNIRNNIKRAIQTYPRTVTIISGGARGVDTLAIEIAKELKYSTLELIPPSANWDGYKIRNMQIAKLCNEIYCFTLPITDDRQTVCYHHGDSDDIDHQKTAGCWTGKKAEELGKPFYFC